MIRLPLPNTKTGRVLSALMTGRSYNRFEAERYLHDHCLNSTVAELQNRYKIKINRRYESFAGYKGKPARCCRYWIDADECMRIRRNSNFNETNVSRKNISLIKNFFRM